MEPFFASTSTGWVKDEYVIASMLSSLDHIKQIGITPKVYCDKITKDILGELIDGVELYDVHTDLFVRDNVPKEFWAYPKMKTYQLQTEPYVHFDLDFIFKRKLNDKWFECDLLCQVWEYPLLLDIEHDGMIFRDIYNKDHLEEHWEWSEWWNKPNFSKQRALNVGILGMQNMELNREYCDLTFDWLDMNRDNLFEKPKKIPFSCVFEQQALAILAKEKRCKVKTLQNSSCDDPPSTDEFTHFVGSTYKKDSSFEGVIQLRNQLIDPYVTDDVIKITKELIKKRDSC